MNREHTNQFKIGIISGTITGGIFLLFSHILNLYYDNPLILFLSIIIVFIGFILMIWVSDKVLSKDLEKN